MKGVRSTYNKHSRLMDRNTATWIEKRQGRLLKVEIDAEERKYLEALFKDLDEDGNGGISFSELKRMMQGMHCTEEDLLSLEKAFDFFDIDHSRAIEMEEFIDMMTFSQRPHAGFAEQAETFGKIFSVLAVGFRRKKLQERVEDAGAPDLARFRSMVELVGVTHLGAAAPGPGAAQARAERGRGRAPAGVRRHLGAAPAVPPPQPARGGRGRGGGGGGGRGRQLGLGRARARVDGARPAPAHAWARRPRPPQPCLLLSPLPARASLLLRAAFLSPISRALGYPLHLQPPAYSAKTSAGAAGAVVPSGRGRPSPSALWSGPAGMRVAVRRGWSGQDGRAATAALPPAKMIAEGPYEFDRHAVTPAFTNRNEYTPRHFQKAQQAHARVPTADPALYAASHPRRARPNLPLAPPAAAAALPGLNNPGPGGGGWPAPRTASPPAREWGQGRRGPPTLTKCHSSAELWNRPYGSASISDAGSSPKALHSLRRGEGAGASSIGSFTRENAAAKYQRPSSTLPGFGGDPTSQPSRLVTLQRQNSSSSAVSIERQKQLKLNRQLSARVNSNMHQDFGGSGNSSLAGPSAHQNKIRLPPEL